MTRKPLFSRDFALFFAALFFACAVIEAHDGRWWDAFISVVCVTLCIEYAQTKAAR